MITFALEYPRQIISILSFILGYFTNEYTGDSILGFLSTMSLGQPPSVIFDYVGFIADVVHYQLTKLPTKGVFRYSSYLFHLFLFSQVDKFLVSLQKMDVEEKPLSIIFWTSLLRKESSDSTYSEFSKLFLHPTMSILKKSEQPRISEEMKRIFQLSEKKKVGDWYLYEKHTELRIFGLNLVPYMLPEHVCMRIFAFEYL